MAIIGKVVARAYQFGFGHEGTINDLLVKERYLALSKKEGVALDEEEIDFYRAVIALTPSKVFFGWTVAISALNVGLAYNGDSPLMQTLNVGAAILLSSHAVVRMRRDSRRSLVDALNFSKGTLSADGETRIEDLLKKGRWSWGDVDRVDAALLVGISSKKTGVLKESLVAMEKNLSSVKNNLEAKRAQLRSASPLSKELALSKPRASR